MRPFAPACFFDAAFFEDFFFETFFFDVLAEDLAGAAFFLREGFFDTLLADFFLLGPLLFPLLIPLRAPLLDALRAADFFAAFFLLPAFLAAFFVAVLRAAGLRRAAAFFFDTFLVEDRFLVLLTLRFFPEAFLRTPGLREDAGALLAPARLRFLLAAFLAGMIDSRVREKRGIIHRLLQHGSPKSVHFGATGTPPGALRGHLAKVSGRAVFRSRISRPKRPVAATEVQRAMRPPVQVVAESGRAMLRLSE